MSTSNAMTRRFLTAAACLFAVTCNVATAHSAQLTGTVEPGGANVKVTLFEATLAKPRALDSARTNAAGQFQIDSPIDESDSIFFVTAKLGFGVKLVTILGPELPAETTINELTTVAASYSMAQFYRRGFISGDPFALRIAAGMNDNIVETATGDSSEVLLTSPNADETNSLRMTRSLSNLLGASIENPLVRFFFLYLTTPPRGSFPQDTAVAMANLARDPGRHARLIYLLSRFQDVYSPALVRRPDGWTVTVKVNDSGDDNFLFGGPANVAFDSRGYAWVTNNVVQGTPNSSRRIMVLQPNGKPAVGGPGLPTSPLTGGGILGTAWGVTVDRDDNAWFGNFGWGSPLPSAGDWPTEEPPGNGSVSVFSPDGTPLSGPEGFYGGAYRVQAIEADGRGNIWMASFGNNRVVVYPNGNPTDAIHFDLDDGDRPFGIAFDAEGAAWVTNSGGLTGRNQSSIAKFVLQGGKLKQVIKRPIGDTLKVVDVDSQGNAWFTSQGSDRVFAIRPDGRFFKRRGYRGGGINGPWGLAVDGEDNIWVANFGQTDFGVFRRGGISKFAGVNPATRPPGKKVGDSLSPRTGYTVPTAGSQVLLHNGFPLNGEGARPVFIPYQRQTSLQIDRAGNIWTINNYKPRWATDILGYDNGEIRPADANPGGDGIIIYVGLAPPRLRGD